MMKAALVLLALLRLEPFAALPLGLRSLLLADLVAHPLLLGLQRRGLLSENAPRSRKVGLKQVAMTAYHVNMHVHRHARLA